MCGIYLTNISEDEHKLREKLELIKYRGPDNMSIQSIGKVSMGHVRLSILDLDSRSNQPFQFDGLTIVFNGEIYNYQSIREELMKMGCSFKTDSDTEVLIQGYKVWGEGVLERLNGMFAFAIYDEVAHQVFCARDRLGVKPFYYSWEKGKLELCSQIRPLIKSDSILSEQAISIYLDCGYIPSPYSIIKGIHKLAPGEMMLVNLKESFLEIKKYWDLAVVQEEQMNYEEAKNRVKDLLTDAIKIRLNSDVALGSFLSGGIDSALVSALAMRVKGKQDPIKTFTIGFDDPNFDESKVAATYAEHIGSIHTETVCGPNDALNMLKHFVKVYDEPFADSSALPSLLLNYVTKKHVTVALSGDGGDESFIGYTHFVSVDKFSKLQKTPFFLRRMVSNLVAVFAGPSKQHLKYVLKKRNISDFIEAIFVGYDSLTLKRDLSWMKPYKPYLSLGSNAIQKAADLNIKLWLEGDSNVKVDRASMAFACEIRSPFLDYRVVEFARKLPLHFKYKDGVRKRILRDILKEYIPEEVFDVPKRGFAIPLHTWLREDLKVELEEHLNDRFLRKVPNLNILKFKKQYKAHMEGQSDYTINIWRLFVLSKWYQEFNF